ncbi:MAG: MBL fold metallo-hydrolase, partial [Desulfomonilia bacterium]|nr:MBL fold metallo-hydrolase [Desulfomonilia bacterium]
MRPSFLSKLVNGPLFDPVVHVKILNERTSLLFDCGWFQGLANREVLRLHALFISHMHMDHFIGFDRILRVILHREHPIHVYGPEGSTEKIILKLQAYSWNLTQNYPLDVIIHEVGPTAVITTHASARSGFQVSSRHNRERSSHTIARQGRFHVDAVILDHNIPTLGFVLREPFHIHILGDVLREKGYRTGTWIGLLKTCILEDRLEEMIPVRMSQGETLCKARTLMHELVRTSRGQKLVYITD